MKLVFQSLIICSVIVSQAVAQDAVNDQSKQWGQWRGPSAAGTAIHADPPVRWSESENIKWKVEVPGKGSATPIVWNNKIFMLTAVKTDKQSATVPEETDDGTTATTRRGRRGFGRGAKPTNFYKFVVQCLDLETGDRIWEQIATEAVPHEGHHPTGTFASCSPITDGQYLFASFGSRGIYCYDMDGKIQWQRDLGDMRCRNSFGEGGSPALAGDFLIVPWDHEEQSKLYALDTKSGEIRWQVDRDEPTTWGTPLVAEADGRTQVVMNGTTRVRSYDARDGSLIWECGGQAFNPVASPIRFGDLVCCTTGRRGFATSAMPLSATGDITGTDKVAWHRTDSGAYVASPVIYQGRLYHIKGTSAVVSCLDASSGEAVFGPSRLPGLRDIYASPVAAADRIYFSDRKGATVVLGHGDQLDVLATNTLDEGCDASLVLVGNQILLRGSKHLYCIAKP